MHTLAGPNEMFTDRWSEGRVSIRPVGLSDIEPLFKVWEECLDASPSDPTFHRIPVSKMKSHVERLPRSSQKLDGFRMLVIYQEGQPGSAGYFHLDENVPEPGTARISTLAIRARDQRKGTGRGDNSFSPQEPSTSWDRQGSRGDSVSSAKACG